MPSFEEQLPEWTDSSLDVLAQLEQDEQRLNELARRRLGNELVRMNNLHPLDDSDTAAVHTLWLDNQKLTVLLKTAETKATAGSASPSLLTKVVINARRSGDAIGSFEEMTIWDFYVLHKDGLVACNKTRSTKEREGLWNTGPDIGPIIEPHDERVVLRVDQAYRNRPAYLKNPGTLEALVGNTQITNRLHYYLGNLTIVTFNEPVLRFEYSG